MTYSLPRPASGRNPMLMLPAATGGPMMNRWAPMRADEVVPLAQGPVRDAVPRVLHRLDPVLDDDADLVATVAQQTDELTGDPDASSRRRLDRR